MSCIQFNRNGPVRHGDVRSYEALRAKSERFIDGG